MAAFRNLIVKVGADTADVEKKLRGLTRPFNSISNAADKVGKSLTVGLTVPIAALAVAATKAAADFQAGMNKVRAVTGATGADFQKLEDLAKQLGATTKFSASEAADAMGFLGQAGFDTAQILEAVPSTLNLAAAGSLELGRAADIASNVLQGFGLNASEAARVSDVLAQSAASTNTNVEQMGEALSFVAPVAKSLGVSLEETAAAVGALSDAGIQGARAGTNLRAVLSKLISPTKEAADIFKNLGIEVTNLDGSLKPLPEVVNQLGRASLNTNQLIAIFGEKMAAAAGVIIDRGGPALAELSTSFRNAGGAAERMAKIMDEGAKGGIKALMSALESLAIAVLDTGLLDFFEKMVRGAAELVRGLASASPGILAFGATIAGFAAAIGPALLAFASLKPAIIAVGTVIAGISAPVGIAVAAVALLAGGLAAVAASADEAKDEVKDLEPWRKLSIEVGDLRDEVKALGGEFRQGANESLEQYRDRLRAIKEELTALTPVQRAANERFIQTSQSLQTGFKATEDYVFRLEAMKVAMNDGAIAAGNLSQQIDESARKASEFEQAVQQQVEALRKQARETVIAEEAARRYKKEIGEVAPALFDMATGLAKAVKSTEELAKEQDELIKKTQATIQAAQTSSDVWRGYGDNIGSAGFQTLQLIGAFDRLNPKLNDTDLAAVRIRDTFRDFGVVSDQLANEQLARMAEQLEFVRQNVGNFGITLNDVKNLQEAYNDFLKKKGGAIQTTGEYAQVLQAVSTVVTDFSNAVADAILSSSSLSEAFVKTMESLAKALIRIMVEGALKELGKAILANEDAVKSLINTFKKLFNLGGGGGAPRPGGGGGGRGGGEGPTLTGIPLIDILKAISDLILGIIQAFQLARIEGTLNAIEENTRRATLFLGDRADQGIIGQLFKVNEHLLRISSDQLNWMLDDFDTLIANQATMVERLTEIRDKIGGSLPATSFSGVELLLKSIREAIAAPGEVNTVVGLTQQTIERLDQAFVYQRDIRAPQLERIAGHLSDIEDLMRLLVQNVGSGGGRREIVAISGRALAEAEFNTFTEGGLIP